MDKLRMADELLAMKRVEPALYGIILGHGTAVTIASAAGRTVGGIKEDLERLHRAGRITKLYGRSWVINTSHEGAGELKALRDGAIALRWRK